MATITKENKIHFFIKDKSDQEFINIDLESYMEIPQRDDKIDFKRIEDLRLFFKRNIEEYECAGFQIEFGRNDCHFSGCKTVKELYKYMQSDSPIYNFKPVSKKEYLELRDEAFEIFLKHKCADYSKLEIGSEFSR